MDAVDDLAEIFRKVAHPDDPHVDAVLERGRIAPEELPGLLAGYDLPCSTTTPRCQPRRCAPARSLRHIIFLGTGARSCCAPRGARSHRHQGAHPSRATATPRSQNTASP